MPRFYCTSPLSPDLEFDADAGLTRHLQVLRLQPGDAVQLFDGSGGEYSAEVLAMGKRSVRLRIGGWQPDRAESPLHSTLLQGVASSEHMDYALQKAVECGVSVIQPVWTQRSQGRLSGERAEKRQQHWQAVVYAACEQSGRTRPPLLLPLQNLADALARQPADSLKRVLAPDAGQGWASLPARASQVALLVGAEGGLSAEEIALAGLAGFGALQLGPRILRTETAGPTALALLQARYGDY